MSDGSESNLMTTLQIYAWYQCIQGNCRVAVPACWIYRDNKDELGTEPVSRFKGRESISNDL